MMRVDSRGYLAAALPDTENENTPILESDWDDFKVNANFEDHRKNDHYWFTHAAAKVWLNIKKAAKHCVLCFDEF